MCVLLSPPGYEVLALILLTHLQSFTWGFSSRQALFPGLGRGLPTDIRPCWNQQSKPVR